MSASSSSIFSGNSRYASDFQSVIDRATAIASLPLRQLENDVAKLNGQSSALAAMDEKFAALQSSLQGLDSVLSGSFFSAAVSDEEVVSVSVGAGALEGNYTIEVSDAGAFASSMTAGAWQSAAAGTTYGLKIGADTIGISPSAQNASGVAAAINAAASGRVRATVINAGTVASPDERIVLQSTRLGDLTPALEKEGVDLQTEQTAGRVAKYIVGGSGLTVESSTRAVALAEGLTVNLLSSKPGAPVDITLTRSSEAVNGALAGFAAAYNATLAQLDGQRGANDGILAGQSILYTLSQSLRSLATYTSGGGQVSTLADLGLTLDNEGKLSYNTFAFLAQNVANPAAVTSFLGSAGGGGFLALGAAALASIEQTDSGLLKTAQSQVKAHIERAQDRIGEEQIRIDAQTVRLQEQMAAADAIIAGMEQQYNYIANMFAAMKSASESYR